MKREEQKRWEESGKKINAFRNKTPRAIHPVSGGQVRKMDKVDAI